MRYYAVGAPVEDLKGNLFFGVKTRNISQEDLEKLSFYNQDTIEKVVDINFQVANPFWIKKDDLVRAEFYNSGIAPVEFMHNKPSETCAIM